MQNIPTNRRAELVIWHLTDSALPTGGFAHSAGLESYIAENEVHDAATFTHWLEGYLHQASFNEALALRLALELYNSDEPVDAKLDHLAELDALVHACQTPLEVRNSMNSMGKRWSRVAAIVADDDPLVLAYRDKLNARELAGNPGIAAGLVLAATGLPAEEAVRAYLMQMANSMTQNAIRAIPLGQDAGQRVLVDSYHVVEEAAARTMLNTIADLGVVAPRLEVAQMAHESLRSRMFMS
ncbi:urease accessory protein UreF [Corynebacterium singulare]|uniref:Urease accessory protein UreF n=1 Tax=Corynebacterium singulare TaxID=161899 RepID=A0A0B6EU19_9CORY|nr:urease accessory UreF family protein [Corynebacterium singulare]AJI79977.1 urease accessory protein UreF [Corynebacterium singulare]